MNPFDEQEAKIYIDLGTQLAEAKLKKLYTWHDIEAVKEEAQKEYEALPEYDENWGWIFATGIGVGFIIAVIALHLLN